MKRFRAWWYRRTHRPFDWYEEIPELREPTRIRRITGHRAGWLHENAGPITWGSWARVQRDTVPARVERKK